MYRNKSLLVQLNLLFSDLTQKFGSLKFKDAFDLSGGYAFKSTQYKNTGVFILRVTNINEDGTIDKKDAKFIAPLNDEDYKDYQLRFGDVLIVMIGGSIGKVGFVDQESLPAFLNQNMWLVRSSKGYSQKYIFYLCLYLCHYHATEKNTSYGFYSRKKFKELIVPNISPQDSFAISSIIDKIANQENIYLNDIFSRKIIQKITSIQVNSNNINHLKSELNNQQLYINQLKQAILQEAISGQLTAEWRKQNPMQKGDPDTDAAALLAKIKAEKQQLIADGKLKKEKPLPPISPDEIPFSLPDSWVWCRLGEICTKVTDGFHHTPKKQLNGSIYISATHIREWGINWNECLYINKEEHQALFKKAYPQKGEILITNRGAGCGTPVIIDIDEEFSFQNAALIGFNQSFIISKYVFNFILKMRSEIMINFVNGGLQPMLSNVVLRTIPFPLPPSAEQKAIVEKVDYLMKIIEQLEAQIKHRKQLAEELMQTVLREAFE